MMSTDSVLTIEEREFLKKDVTPSMSGFKLRQSHQLATKRAPKTLLNIECNHLLRTSQDESTHKHHSLEYRLWVEAGKHDPPFPKRPDPNYNSNVWRNFRQAYGFHTNVEGRKVTEMIAAMYPLNLPKASHVGKYTFAKFLKETPLIRSAKERALAIARTETDVHEFKQLKAKSDVRNPPIDTLGNILPPEHYKKYEHNLPCTPPEMSQPEPEDSESKRVDIFGRYVPTLSSRRGAYPWKLDYKQNHPNIRKVIEDLESKSRGRSPKLGLS